MRKLTDEELREPDIVLSIPLSVWRKLPDEVKKHLEAYIDYGNDAHRVYKIPAYLARELEKIATEQAGDDT